MDNKAKLELFINAIFRNAAKGALVVFVAGVIGMAVGFLVKPIYTARARILVPSQGMGSGMSALAGLAQAGAIVPGLGQLGSAKNVSDQLIGLMRSRIVIDDLIKIFDLKTQYQADYMFQAREMLLSRTQIRAGKDGFIDIEVEDESPDQSARLARAYVARLQDATNKIAIGEAASRKKFLENQLSRAKKEWEESIVMLTARGVPIGVLNMSPEAGLAARLRTAQTIQALEQKLRVLRVTHTDESQEVALIKAELQYVRTQLRKIEVGSVSIGEDELGVDQYVTALKRYKQSEAMYEGLTKQYEQAKLDEAKEGVLIQVVDDAEVPEWKTRPSRLKYMLIGLLVGVLVFFVFVFSSFARLVMTSGVASRNDLGRG